jgi:tetratricopeptide (TPR) repeat protein
MIAALVAVLAIGFAQLEAPTVSPSDLDAVKSLYAQAAYEDALQRLSSISAEHLTEQLDRYRALSLLALGRGDEAEQTFERMVRRDPLYALDATDVSPRVAAVFAAVRARTLPDAAREWYARGKSSYDQHHYADAVTQLTVLLAALADPAMPGSSTAVDDMKQLAEGFLRLSQIEVDAAVRAAMPPPVVLPAAPVAPPPSPPPAEAPASDALVVTKIVIYSASDTGVVPPIELERRMPPWTPPNALARTQTYRGALEVIVDEAGGVESARMATETVPAYDVTLLDAARRWRYRAAMRNAQPVKYRLIYNVVLGGGQ